MTRIPARPLKPLPGNATSAALEQADDHVVRARIAHGLQERGPVGDVVGVARRRVAGESGFDVTSFRPVLPLTLTLNLR